MLRSFYHPSSVSFSLSWQARAVWGAALLATSAHAAELNGLYRWGSGHTLSVKTVEGRVEGHVLSPGPCRFNPERPVLTGEWEGNVLVGDVTLCEVGPGCAPSQYAFLGFYNASDGSLTADLELE